MVGSWDSKGVVNGDPGKDGLSSESKRIWGNRLVGCMIYENCITSTPYISLFMHTFYRILSYRSYEPRRERGNLPNPDCTYHPFSPRPKPP